MSSSAFWAAKPFFSRCAGDVGSRAGVRDLHVEVGHWRVRRSLDAEVEYRALPSPAAVGPAHPAVPTRDVLFSVHCEPRTRELLRPEVPLPVVCGGPVAAH